MLFRELPDVCNFVLVDVDSSPLLVKTTARTNLDAGVYEVKRGPSHSAGDEPFGVIQQTYLIPPEITITPDTRVQLVNIRFLE